MFKSKRGSWIALRPLTKMRNYFSNGVISHSSKNIMASNYLFVGIVIVAICCQIIFPYNIIDYIYLAGIPGALASYVFIVALLVLLALTGLNGINWPLFVVLGAVLVFVVLSSVVSPYSLSYADLRSVVMNLIVIYVVAMAVSRAVSLDRLLKIITGVGVFAAILSILYNIAGNNLLLEMMYGPNLGKYGTGETIGFGFTYNSVQSSLVLLLSLGTLIAYSKKLHPFIVWIATFLLVIGIVVAGSRSALLAVIAVIVWLAIVRVYLHAVLLLVFLVIASSANILGSQYGLIDENSALGKSQGSRVTRTDVEEISVFLKAKPIDDKPVEEGDIKEPEGPGRSGISFRLNMYSLSLEFIKESPLFGIGLGNFPRKARERITEDESARMHILNISGNENIAARVVATLVEKNPRDFGYKERYWTIASLLDEARKQNDTISRAEYNRSIMTGAATEYSEWVEGMDTHNMYLSIAVELGILVVIIIFTIFLRLVIKIVTIARISNLENRLIGAGAGVAFVGAAVIGIFWHIQLYREFAIIVGFFVGAYLQINKTDLNYVDSEKTATI